METKVAPVASAPDPKVVKAEPPAVAAPRAVDTAPVPTPDQDPVAMRLVIEIDKASGGYVYKTVNRLTGEVVSQLPRAEVLRLHQADEYEPGSVISTEA
jgi:flagellar protein FlaG